MGETARDVCSAVILSALVLAWVCAVSIPGCRASLPVAVQVYSCQTAVSGSQGVTLEQCRVVDEVQQGADQQGDDTVDVQPKASPVEPGVELRAYGPPVALLGGGS